MKQAGASQGLLRSLDLAVVLTVAFTLFFRMMNTGQDLYSIPSAFLDLLVFFAALLWLVGRLAAPAPELRFPKAGIAALFFLAATWLAAFAARNGGDFNHALLFAKAWTLDAVLFFLIFDCCRTRERRALMCAALVSAVAVLVVYCLYQRVYGLGYFQRFMMSHPELLPKGEQERALFVSRLMSGRITGPYGYSNLVANYVLMFLPMVWYCALRAKFSGSEIPNEKKKHKGKVRKKRNLAPALFIVLAALGHMAVAYSGSKGGLLAGKIITLAGLCVLAWRSGENRGRKTFETFCFIILTTILGGVLVVCAKELLGLGETGLFTVYGVAWFAEIILAYRLCIKGSLDKKLSVGVRVCGGGAVALGLCLTLWLGLGAPGAPEKVSGKVASAKESWTLGKDSASVRKNYWVAAVRMISERPLRGMGLDQYGNYYTSYKPMEGWAVKRVHNTYLQILTDGGVLLLVPWLVFWVMVLKGKRSEEDLPGEDAGGVEPAEARKNMLVAGLLAIAAVFFLQYVARVLFGGLSLEYFWNEVTDKGEFVMPRNPLPALAHLLTHIVLLPAFAAAAFAAGWKIFCREGDEHRFLRSGIALGLVVCLLHIFVDFTYHTRAISTTMWALAAVLLSCGVAKNSWALRVKLPRRALDGIILVLVACFCLTGWGVLLKHWQVANMVNRLDALEKQDLGKAARLCEEWTVLTPGDVMSHRRMARMLMGICVSEAQSNMRGVTSAEQAEAMMPSVMPLVSRELREKTLAEARLSVELNPAMASGHAFVGRVLLMLFPESEARQREALSSFAEASKRHPYKPEYLLWLARLHSGLGEQEKARELARQALEMNFNPNLSDERAQLKEEQVAMLEELCK